MLIFSYVLGGIIFYLYHKNGINDGYVPISCVVVLTFVLGVASVAMLMAGLKGMAELLESSSNATKTLVYYSLMVAWASSSTTYAVITTEFL